MSLKKIVLPGQHLASAEEVLPGENTYSENDELYSSTFGEVEEREHKLEVSWEQTRKMPYAHLNMELYCVVTKIGPTKAFVDCIPAESFGKKGSSIEVSAVLPVQNIRSEHVRDMKDEVRTGDILKAKISRITREGVDISIFNPNYGVVRAFCTQCRNRMVLKAKALICTNCGKQDRRKISEEYPEYSSEK